MDEFPSNSRSEQPASARPEVKKVISSTPITRKQPLGSRLKQTFFSGADSRSVFEYVFTDILVPQIKEMFVDASTTAVERAIFGESRSRRAGTRFGGYITGAPASTRVNYGTYSAAPSAPPWRSQPAAPASAPSPAQRALQGAFEEVILPSRGDAEIVLDTITEIWREYRLVSVADLYSTVGITPNHTDHGFGWDDLSDAKITSVRGGGYLIDLPRPIPIR